jgi:enamine deaminase RidA (YjgF/YER057c/UK114 family)
MDLTRDASSAALPHPSAPSGLYSAVRVHRDVAYVSGQLPRLNNELQYIGKVGEELTLAQVREAARLCAAQTISVLSSEVGGLENIECLLKVTGFVASPEGFNQQPHVLDAASAYYVEVLGERGRHARSAIGVAELPRGAPVEIELIAALRPGWHQAAVPNASRPA